MDGDISVDVSQYTDSNGDPDMGKITAEAERRGLDAASKQSWIADIARRVAITVAKAKNVYNDAETGAEYGSVVPVYGTAIGTAAGALYGVVDQFGDDIKSAFGGGPRWTEAEYQAMRDKCVACGGVSVYGKPPNNLDSCQFPDGSLSGGDNPVWENKEAYLAELEADRQLRAANLANLSSYIVGLKKIDAMIASADAAVRATNKTPGRGNAAIKVREVWLKSIGTAFGTLYNATKLDSQPPANVAGFLKDNQHRIYTPPFTKLAIGHPLQVAKAATDQIAALKKLPVVHMTMLAAKNGDPIAKAIVAATATAADTTNAPPQTKQAAEAMSFTLKLQKRASYVTYWLYGDGAKKVQPAA